MAVLFADRITAITLVMYSQFIPVWEVIINRKRNQ